MTAETPVIIDRIGGEAARKRWAPTHIIVVPSGEPAPGVLFRAGHRMLTVGIDAITSAPEPPWSDAVRMPHNTWARPEHVRRVDIYRGRSARVAAHPRAIPVGQIVPQPVSEADREAMRRLLAGDKHQDCDDYVDSCVRFIRGDLDRVGDLTTSHWRLSEQQAYRAKRMNMEAEQLFCGVSRLSDGRWLAYRGLGAIRVKVMTADTFEQAAIIAHAALWHAWWTRLQSIYRAR